MAEDVQQQIDARRATRKRAFRPFFLWLPFAVLLVGWDAHLRLLSRTRLHFSVAVEGHPLTNGYSATLDGAQAQAGQRIGLSHHMLQIAMPDAEPEEKRFFAWYGRNALGEFNLTAHKGALEIAVDPPPKVLMIAGRWFSTNLASVPVSLATVPIGDYRVAAVYDWLREEKPIRVQRGQKSRLELRPQVGSLDLTVEPKDAAFRLTSLNQPAVKLDGQTPAELRHLPAGRYHLRVWRGDYLKESTVEIKRGETNRITVTFEYGQVQLVSEPAGATVYDGDREIGQTPRVFNDLKPGRYRFRLEQAGYEPAQVGFEVRGSEPVTVKTNLVNIRYKAAMQKARRLVSSSPLDYREALAAATETLDAQPGDPEATELRTKLEAGLAADQARQAEAQKQTELATRRLSGANLFKQETDKLKDAALFDAHMWTVQTNLAAVCEALRRTFEKGPQHRWTVEKQTGDGDTSAMFQCKGNSSFQSKRSCVVMAYQISPQEVQVHAKFWDYLFGGILNILVSGGSQDSKWIPMHPGHVARDQVQNVEERRRKLAEGFWKILQNELR